MIFASAVQAQVGSSISADGSAPNNNAMLDVKSPSTGDGKGLLIPRVTQAQRTNAAAALAGGLLDDSGNLRGGAAHGLIVYQTNGVQGLYFNTSLTATPVWALLGADDSSVSIGRSANGSSDGAAVGYQANGYFYGAAMGREANGSSVGAAMGWGATGTTYGAAMGAQAKGSSFGAAMGYQANGLTYGAAVGYQADGSASGAAVGYQANGYIVGAALGWGATGSNHGAAMGQSANGDTFGAAVGKAANGSTGAAVGHLANGSDFGAAVGRWADGSAWGAAVGRNANGSQTNVAIGAYANAQGGTQQIAIGNNVTNNLPGTARIRGTLYLDGATNIYCRTNFASGVWYNKAFEIDHPLDPANKVLRHFCLEGPQVWNVYAGNAQLVNGRAVVELPDYYSALNLVGSEIYSLTVVDESANLFPQVKIARKAADNRFVIAGNMDVEVSWTIKVLRNDPGCLEDLRRRPVEQLKSEIR